MARIRGYVRNNTYYLRGVDIEPRPRVISEIVKAKNKPSARKQFRVLHPGYRIILLHKRPRPKYGYS